MFTHFLFLLFYTALPAILFLIPATRKRNSSWLIAWKTVPAGFAAVTILDYLLSRTPDWIADLLCRPVTLPEWLCRSAIPVSLLAGFFTWLVLTLRLKRKADNKYSFFPAFAACFTYLVGSIGFSIAVMVFGFFLCMFFPHFQPNGWHRAWLPKQGENALALEYSAAHPFLAEYFYRLKFVRNGERSTHALLMNTGGQIDFKVYRLKDGRLYMEDKDNAYIVNPAEREVLHVYEGSDGHFYVSRLPDEPFEYSYTTIRADGVYRGYNGKEYKAEPADHLLKDKVYIGRLTKKFEPAINSAY